MCRPVRYTKPALPEHLNQALEEELQFDDNNKNDDFDYSSQESNSNDDDSDEDSDEN